MHEPNFILVDRAAQIVKTVAASKFISTKQKRLVAKRIRRVVQNYSIAQALSEGPSKERADIWERRARVREYRLSRYVNQVEMWFTHLEREYEEAHSKAVTTNFSQGLIVPDPPKQER